MKTEFQDVIRTIDIQISALTKAKEALVAVGQIGRPDHVAAPRTGAGAVTGMSVRASIRAALQRKPKLTARELLDEMVANGWKTASANPLGLVSVMVRKYVQAGEVRATRTTPRRFSVGNPIDRPAKKEPWQKKLDTAQSLVAFDRGVKIAQREMRRKPSQKKVARDTPEAEPEERAEREGTDAGESRD